MPRGKVVSTRRATPQEETDYKNNYKLSGPLWKGQVQIVDPQGDTSLQPGEQYDCVTTFQPDTESHYEGGNIAPRPSILIKMETAR